MAISVSCTCGRVLRLKDTLSGKRIRCPQCQTVLSAPRAGIGTPGIEIVEDEFTVVAPDPTLTPPATSFRAAGTSAQTSRPSAAAEDERPRKRSRHRRRLRYDRRYDDPRQRSPLFTVSHSVMVVITMMCVAVGWLVLGLYFGWIFFYPPILFILGLIAVIRGLTGHEEI